MKRILTLIVNITASSFLISTSYAVDPKDMIVHGKINIIGAEVINLQGKILGEITGLEYDNDTKEITFAVLSYEGETGAGEKMIPVPISALMFRNNNNAVINITRHELESAPVFEDGQRPDMSDRQWSEDIYSFYGIRPERKE